MALDGNNIHYFNIYCKFDVGFFMESPAFDRLVCPSGVRRTFLAGAGKGPGAIDGCNLAGGSALARTLSARINL